MANEGFEGFPTKRWNNPSGGCYWEGGATQHLTIFVQGFFSMFFPVGPEMREVLLQRLRGLTAKGGWGGGV